MLRRHRLKIPQQKTSQDIQMVGLLTHSTARCCSFVPHVATTKWFSACPHQLRPQQAVNLHQATIVWKMSSDKVTA